MSTEQNKALALRIDNGHLSGRLRGNQKVGPGGLQMLDNRFPAQSAFFPRPDGERRQGESSTRSCLAGSTSKLRG